MSEDLRNTALDSAVEGFDLPEYWGELATAWRPEDLGSTVGELTDPAKDTETLHWGRNYLYSAEIATLRGRLEVAVKQFRNQGLRARWERRLKGSKAERSWRAAWALQRAGLPTPEPVLLAESRQAYGPSFFVSRRLRNCVEARYYFRALAAGREQQDFPSIDAELLIETLGRLIRRLHEAGIWHRDLSVGNFLLQQQGEGGEALQISVVDLNRVRLGARMTVGRRTRDLCRLRIFRREHQELLLRSYWQERSRGLLWKRRLYRLCFHSFLVRVEAKSLMRKPLRALEALVLPRRAHVHIPPAPLQASKRDRTVWDVLSDQPHQHAGRLLRTSVRLADIRHHGRELGAALGVFPRAWRRFRVLRRELYRNPVTWEGIGVALRPWVEDPASLLETVERLGVKRLLLRLHPWQEDHRAEEELAVELHRRGYELAFSLPQNRDLVRDLGRWRAAVARIGETFGRFGRHFQIGQAVNRSKWGVWNHVEYLELAATASEILRQNPSVELLGPAVIDYEPHRTAGLLNVDYEGIYFDILASLLYVDRRGAPENRQLGFDTVDKVVQLKAIAEVSSRCGDRSWITEVNWPLWEGPHSPAGRKVSIDEHAQADYLVRYYLLALGTGLVQRIYWWQLVARGYGLSHDEGGGRLRLRPSFHALSALRRQLEGSTFLGPLAASGSARLYRFELAGGENVIVGWSADDRVTTAQLPEVPREVLDRDGRELAASASPEVELDGSPRYFWL